MHCDDGAESADDRDAVVNGIFTAGMILRSQVAQIENGKAVRYIEGAIQQLDGALREIRWAAFARRRDTEA